MEDSLKTLQSLKEMDIEKKFAFLKKQTELAYDFFKIRDQKKMSENLFFTFKKFVEILEDTIEKAKFPKEKFNELKGEILAIKTGANLPLNYFYKQGPLRNFLEINYLERIFFLSKISIRYDRNKGAILPFEAQEGAVFWVFWNDLVWKENDDGYNVFEGKNLLFMTDKNTLFTQEYTALMYGITKYNVITSANFRPYRYEDPATYDYKYLLQVVVNWGNKKSFSYFFQTHAYLELKGPDGMVRSVGQDIFDHIKTLSVFSIYNAINRSAIIMTPDRDCYATKVGRNRKRITFELTKKEFNKVIALVEWDKYDHQTPASALKGNCVSYTCRILKEVLNYEIKGDVGAFSIFWKNILPRRFDNCITRISQKLSKLPRWVQRVLFFLPPVIIFSLIVGVYGKLASMTGFKQYTDYKFWDCIFRPWEIRVDLPLQLYKVLDAYADENGRIERSKFPRGSIFD